jgi:diguanylate cyclase (GGDEF)-like protein/PAS domain S-box-containing protein
VKKLQQRPARSALIVLCLVSVAAIWLFSRGPVYPRPIRVGINQSSPYAFIARDQTITGPSKEVITEAARRRGIPVEWVVAPEGPDAALASGKVDVWPLVTILPERRGRIFFTSAWLKSRFCLLVLRGRIPRIEGDFAGQAIAYRPGGPDLRLLRTFFPRARPVPTNEVHQFQSVCSGEAQAAFVEMKAMLLNLLHRPAGCETAQLNLLPVEGAEYYLAIGANPRFARVANELRAEMDRMDSDGMLVQIYKKWLLSTTEETKIVSELAHARWRTLVLWWGVGVLALATGILIGVVNRVRKAHKIASSAYDFVSAVLDVAGSLVVISDRAGRIVRMNRLCERLSGRPLDDVQGKTVWEMFVPPPERGQVESAFAGLAGGSAHTAQEYHWRAYNGEERLISWSNTVLLNSTQQIDYIVSIGIDITDQKAAEAQLCYEALHDQLTELPNRRHFQRVMESAASEGASAGAPFSLCLCDIDHFKATNDTYGHIAGDEVLSTFSRMVREEMCSRGLAARLGGDEFALILRDVTPVEAHRIIERLRERLANHGFKSSEGEVFRVTATFGVASVDGPFRTVADLFKQADDALYRAKSLGRNRIATAARGTHVRALADDDSYSELLALR